MCKEKDCCSNVFQILFLYGLADASSSWTRVVVRPAILMSTVLCRYNITFKLSVAAYEHLRAKLARFGTPNFICFFVSGMISESNPHMSNHIIHNNLFFFLVMIIIYVVTTSPSNCLLWPMNIYVQTCKIRHAKFYLLFCVANDIGV